MKVKKLVTITLLLITIIMCIPTEALAWIAQDVEIEEPQHTIGDFRLAMVIRAVAVTIPIIYVIMAIIYLKYSEDDKKKKIINILIWLVITVIVVLGLLRLSTMIYGDF